MKNTVYFLATILALLCFAAPGFAKTILVCPSCAISQFETGLAKVATCDTLLLDGGNYTIDKTVIDKPICIIGHNKPVLISKSGDEILTIAAGDVTIRGMGFKGVKTNYLKENAAIHLVKAKNFDISDNTFSDCFFSIYLEKAKKGRISGNRIKGNARLEADSGNGIHAWYCDSLEIMGNTISGHRDGIYFEFVNQSLIKKNVSRGNLRYGLHFMFSNDDVYSGNVFENNGVGVAVMFSRRISMTQNTFVNNWGHASYGLLLKEIYDAQISGNTFRQNTVGIFVEGSNRIKYRSNQFVSNGWAIKFSGGCESNEISENNFLHNSLDMLVSSKLLDNKISDNYWSDYTGYDLDKDGFGDVPHYPVKLYTYMLNQVPESVVLMRSLFVDIINFAEKINPVFTPKDVFDSSPKMTANP